MIKAKVLVLDPFERAYIVPEDCYFKRQSQDFSVRRGTAKDIYFNGRCDFKRASILKLTSSVSIDLNKRLKLFRLSILNIRKRLNSRRGYKLCQ